jgi:hypothetical protein
MKKITAILFATVSFLSCKKENAALQNSSSIIGKWEIRKNYGGFTGAVRIYQPGTGTTLQFNADSTFTDYQAFKLNKQGKFRVIKNAFTFGPDKSDGLYYNGDTYGDPIRIHGDTLTIGVTYTDGIALDYVRISSAGAN